MTTETNQCPHPYGWIKITVFLNGTAFHHITMYCRLCGRTIGPDYELQTLKAP